MKVNKTEPVIGTAAVHLIREMAGVETIEYHKAHQQKSQVWNPENGANFKTMGAAMGWLKKLLKKHGWPKPTTWEIRRSEFGGISVYLIED